MIYVLGILLAISVTALVWLLLAYRKLEKRITWVESSPGIIESMIELNDSLNRFGKAIVEIRCLDQASIFYREPVR